MKAALHQQIPPVASRAAVHLHQDAFAWRVLKFGEEGYNAGVDVFFELDVASAGADKRIAKPLSQGLLTQGLVVK
jgi:hypothetical protein